MIKHFVKCLGSLAATTAATAATAVERTSMPEAHIPFASRVYDFQPDGRSGIYIQDRGRRWYHGTFFAPCNALPFAIAIGYSNRGETGINRFATIIAEGERCQLNSFVESAPPPSKYVKKSARGDASSI